VDATLGRTAPSEFTAEQNLVIGQLAVRMQTVGIALMTVAMLLGAKALASGPGSGTAWMQAGILLVLIGLWSFRSGRCLSRVRHTQGNDLGHLMSALGEIRNLYELQFWMLVMAVVLLALSVLVAVLGGEGWFFRGGAG
jgi:hypothetical protein